MKKLFLVLVMTLSTLPAFAQRYNCQVVAVDRYHRVLATFTGSRDYRGMCRNALAFCHSEVRRRGWWDARCLQTRTRW